MLLTQILQKIKSAFYTKSEIDTKLSGKSDISHNHNSAYLGIKAKAESAKSADSVAWANVSGKPTIPTVNNATLTIQKNGTTVKTFTANSSTNVTANITVPTKTSELTNDSGYLTSGNVVDRSSNQNINGEKTFNNVVQAENGLIVQNDAAPNNSTHINNGWMEMSFPEHCYIDFKHETNQDYLGRIGLNPDNTLYLATINGAPIMANGKNIVRSVNGVNADSNGNVNIQNSPLPIGSYIQFAGSQAPSGFLVCNGGAISRTTYANLFAVIGTTYGSGDGSTTFNLPNLTDRFLQGSTRVGTVKYAGLPNIMGTINIGTVDNAPESYSNGALSIVSAGDQGYQRAGGVRTLRSISFDASNYNKAYGNSSTIQPPALTCLICIKY